MKIHFCDLCNESVPDGDLTAGKAFLRKGRVVCASCDAAMTSQEEGAAAGAGRSAAPALPPPPVPVGSGAGESSRGSWIGVLALLFAAASAWFFSGELSSLRERQEGLRGSMDREFEGVGRDLDGFSLRAQRRDVELEGRMQRAVASGRADAEAGRAGLREELRAAQEQLASIDVELVRLARSQSEGDEATGRRIDDLKAQSMKSRQVLDGLATRLEETEVALAQQRAQQVVPVAGHGGPKYAAEIADLSNEAASTRWNAVQSLGETGDPEVVPYLVPLLDDTDVFVRMAVARVFGDLGSPLAIEPLIEALQDEESVMREAAMAALHILTGRDFRFDPFAKPGERAKRVQAWRDWWKKARDEYFGDL